MTVSPTNGSIAATGYSGSVPGNTNYSSLSTEQGTGSNLPTAENNGSSTNMAGTFIPSNNDSIGDRTSSTGTAISSAAGSISGKPIDSSEQLLTMVQQEGALTSSGSTVSTSTSGTPQSWETVGNSVYGTNGGSQALGTSQTTTGSDTGNPSTQVGIPAGPVINKEQKFKDDKDFEKDPHAGFASSTEMEGAVNLSELARRPSNSSVERPVLIECYADKIVIPKQSGFRSPQTISLQNDGKTVEKELLESTVQCIKGWGLAGQNMYWHPWIKVSVHTGGERTVQGVQQLFQAQGITVKQ